MTSSKRYQIFIPIIIIFLIVTIIRLYDVMFVKSDYYLAELERKTNRIILGSSAPRGRILDRNGNIIVDNIGVKTINYTKLINVSEIDEIDIAASLAKVITLEEEINDITIKEYWLINNKEEGDLLISKDENELLSHRKLTNDDIYKLKLERITEEMLEEFTDEEKVAAKIYEMMNKGYKYEKKVIKNKNVTESEVAILTEMNIQGITLEQTWERVYPYGNTMRSILGNISLGLPLEEKEYYLTLGYNLTDRVGISFLERQYEEYLKGEKDLYYINFDNTLSLYKEGKRGNDLILSVDINIQRELESILMNKLAEAKEMKNTEYFNHAYSIISEPLTGSILAISGKGITKDMSGYKYTDITSNIITSSYTMGSVVKGASITVGYQNDLITPGKKIMDSCVKLYFIPEKCSFMRLGRIDDVDALAWSSNYYQFLIAIGLTGNKYKPHMQINATREHFRIYRDTLASFGLGNITGIDLPGEQTGITGTTVADDLLLNLSIGQYDTYTPIQILQYINTIAADGKRIKPSLMLQIIDEKGSIIKKNESELLNSVNIKPEYLSRIQQGFHEVVTKGTSLGYINKKYNGAGKTGTSESFYDSDGDGVVDVATIGNVFAMYAPYDNPKYSLVVVVPNISHNNGSSSYIAPMNRLISRSITDFLFENY